MRSLGPIALGVSLAAIPLLQGCAVLWSMRDDMELSSAPDLTEDDRAILGEGFAACRQNGLDGKCWKAFPESQITKGMDKIRAAHERFKLLRGRKDEAARLVELQSFKQAYGLSDSDITVLRNGVAIWHKLSLPSNCVALVDSKTLERAAGSAVSPRDLLDFEMARSLSVAIDRRNEQNRTLDSERRNASSIATAIALQNAFQPIRSTTTTCSMAGGMLHCSGW